VVDGQQRLTSVCSYISGKYPDARPFPLSSLQVLTELNGKTFKDLKPKVQDAIQNTTLRVIVIQQGSDPDVKFEVFERLNLGAEKLNAQELRNSMYRGRYNDLLKALAEHPKMLKIMGLQHPHKRMLDRELILRFFAMRRVSHLNYKRPMKRFLNREMEGHRNPTDSELTDLRQAFEKSIDIAYTVFGEKAFRRFIAGRSTDPNGRWETQKLNSALWHTLLYTFNYFEKSEMVPIADRVREEFLDLIVNDQKFSDYVSSTSVSLESIQYRADVWRQRLRNLVAERGQGPRTFSQSLKQDLFDANPTCAICGQRIYQIDDAEVDHIEHYWRGGKTIPENARLTHRYCNRSRALGW